MRIAHFEAGSGIAGDMTVAALLDAGRKRGLDLAGLRAALAHLALAGYELTLSPVEVGGLAALRFGVDIDHAAHHHRHWSDIRAMLVEARARGLGEGAFEGAVAIFQMLAEAEAEVHGVEPDHIHFHEVGAVDSIVDIVAAAWCLDQLGIEQCTVSPVATGSGFVDTEHGRLPVPAPATALLLRGLDIRLGDGEGELTTPTGAAILAAKARSMRPVMAVDAVGVGAGTRRLADRPNVLRVFLGIADEDSDESLVLLEADIDDMSPAALAQACERIREAGVRDVSLLPLQMKKNRLAMRLSVLADPALLEAATAALLTHTSSIGVRYRSVQRAVLPRRIETVATAAGSVRVKVVVRPDGSETAEPEFEDVARLARETGRCFADLRSEALRAFERL